MRTVANPLRFRQLPAPKRSSRKTRSRISSPLAIVSTRRIGPMISNDSHTSTHGGYHEVRHRDLTSCQIRHFLATLLSNCNGWPAFSRGGRACDDCRPSRNVVKANEIHVFAVPMFRYLEEVWYAFETAGACKISSDIVERNRDDRIYFDLTVVHSVSFADCYVRPMPYANAAGDRTGSDAIAQILYEEHTSSLARSREIRPWWECQTVASAQRAHSKLQKPPHVPAPGSGAAAAATNTQWQERTAAGVTRARSSSRPRRLAAGPTDRRFLSACEGS